ncbi:MAG: hypothetical protein EOM68_01690 [Spirochaetia bacterium]|nr:hypothetical protein [Spirochaetia bacterium]
MNRRRTILLLCILLTPFIFTGCQTYTASKGKATIAPIASVSEEKTITKYSVLQEEKDALLREKALQEQQERDALALRQQAERDKRLGELTAREKELESSLAALKTLQEAETEKNQHLVDTLAQLTLEKEELALGTQLSSQDSAQYIEQLNQQNADSIEELTQQNAERIEQLNQQSTDRIEELQQQNAQLSAEIFELQSLMEENKTLQQEQKAERQRLELEREDLLSEQESERLKAWQDLTDERDALTSEMRMLKAQLEEKTLTIEEKVRLEQLRSDEARRLEQERLAKRLEQEAEEKRLNSQEQAKLMALEKEWRQIPPLDQITYPRFYKTEKPTELAKEGEKLRALMLPLSDVPWKDSKVVQEVHRSISDLDVPIVFVTGHMENVIALVREMRSNAAIFSTGAIITSFPIQDLNAFGADIQYQEKKTVRLVVANLPEYQVVEQFARKGDWQTMQKNLEANRLTHLKGMLGEGSLTVATLLGASLYEPSHRDWNTFSPVAYRQMDYLWPLSSFLENEGFYDTYRLTHFSEATNAGNTLVTGAWKERVDFLYSRKILPLESAMLTIGGESAPDDKGVSRFGILGTFLVP